ncbi:hypothetical protein BDZ90DRAFT_231670 [Jaminaea rosea]|uniref:Rab-GAP TBC domain-containing protein n=1 Tax=Jaminaea rosea TaxID=1569628 RepID=A0A316URH5_9BASI|nr:hypothetical protein BDZ90DRAFT_231670 [Jaminaea rosea]PWN27896.1 hypothetical protein BDZ90DRAFT_231670 [Jaminaea rosea]
MSHLDPTPPPSSLISSLLSPTDLLPSHACIDHYSLRHLILSRTGLPDSPSWLRAQGWKVLLGFLGNDKKEWPREEAKKRQEYYELLSDLLPATDAESSSSRGASRYDALITQIHLDLVRSRFAQSFSFFRQRVPPSASCPLAPLPPSSDTPAVKRLPKRKALRQRLTALGHVEGRDGESESQDEPRSDAILRILFLYALLNPSVGYVQGMVEVASVVVWTIGSATGLPTETDSPAESNTHFEADAFWCFSLLLGELRELWDFEGLDDTRAGLRIRNPRQSPGAPTAVTLGGMARALRSLGGRLRWADEELWTHLYNNGLSPSIPYYSFRWLATLLSTSLPLPSVVKVWDVILCEAGEGSAGKSSRPSHSQRVDFLLDVMTSLLVCHRNSLLDLVKAAQVKAQQEAEEGDVERFASEEIFSSCMSFLQDLPDRDDDIGPVLEMASMLRQKRIASALTGEDAPPDDEEEMITSSETMGQRTFGAFSRLASGSNSAPPTSSTKGGWLRSVSGTRDSQAATRQASVPPSSLLHRFQASDAAAELSKVGSNWQACAMDKWSQARRSASESVAPPQPPSPSASTTSASSSAIQSTISSRLASLSSAGAAWMRGNGATTKDRAFSTSSTPRYQHPAVLQWSQDTDRSAGNGEGLPNFPLPDVMDSPDGRTEYAYVRPASMMMAGLGFGSMGGVSPVHDRTQRRGVASIPEEWRFPTSAGSRSSDRSPSISAVATMTSSSMSSSASSTGSAAGNGTPRGAGPKPLLLAGSARAAVSTNGNEEAHHTPPPPSKIVRNGPLAGSGSPYTPRGQIGIGARRPHRPRIGDSSIDSGRPDESVDGDSSIVDLLATPGKTHKSLEDGSSERGDADDHGPQRNTPTVTQDGRTDTAPTLATSTSLQAALQTEGVLPKLPSLRAAGETAPAPGRALRGENGTTAPRTASATPGTVTAGAFGRPSKDVEEAPDVSAVVESDRRQLQRPAFGSISSSSDVPLVPTEGRSVLRRPMAASTTTAPSSHRRRSSQFSQINESTPGSPTLESGVLSSGSARSTASRHAARRAARRTSGLGEVVTSSSGAEADPSPTSIDTSPRPDGDEGPRHRDEAITPIMPAERKIYTLVDEPVSLVEPNIQPTQLHDPPAPPPPLLNRASVSSVRSSSSSNSAGASAGSGGAGGSGPIVRSKRSFKTGAKKTRAQSGSVVRSPLTREDPRHTAQAEARRESARLDGGFEEAATTTTTDSLASARTTAESLPSSSPPSSVVSSPFARGGNLPPLDAQLHAMDLGSHPVSEDERPIDELPTSAAHFDDDEIEHGHGHGHAPEDGEHDAAYEYYEYFGDEHHPSAQQQGLAVNGGGGGGFNDGEESEEEEEEGDDGMAAIGSAMRKFSAGMQGGGGANDILEGRRDSAGGIKF